jgi:hypothetical protein
MSNAASGRPAVAAVGRRVVLALAIAVSVVVAGGWTSRTAPDGGGHDVTVLRGTVDTVNATAATIGFRGERVAGPPLRVADVDGGWAVAGASWSDGQAWHDHGTATCLRDDAAPPPVELGVIEVAPYGHAPGRAVVVWLKCLSHP